VVSPDSLPPLLSTASPIKTPDLQYPGPSASLVETEETPEPTEEDRYAPEPALERDIQIDLPLINCSAHI
jgi:hypothetical protein